LGLKVFDSIQQYSPWSLMHKATILKTVLELDINVRAVYGFFIAKSHLFAIYPLDTYRDANQLKKFISIQYNNDTSTPAKTVIFCPFLKS
jgi:hypothetical protein